MVEFVAEQMVESVVADGSYRLPFGSLVMFEQPARQERKGRNPATGEEIVIAAKPAQKTIKFRISKAAKESLNK